MCKQIQKSIIVLSHTIEEADEYIESLGYKTVDEKTKHLQNLFEINLISKKDKEDVTEEESKLMDYHAMLNSVINGKGQI